MIGQKKWWTSKTIQGGVITMLMFILTVSGVDLDKGLVTEFVGALFHLIGIAMVIYGRVKAQTSLTL
jgi:hypothetical protein